MSATWVTLLNYFCLKIQVPTLKKWFLMVQSLFRCREKQISCMIKDFNIKFKCLSKGKFNIKWTILNQRMRTLLCESLFKSVSKALRESFNRKRKIRDENWYKFWMKPKIPMKLSFQRSQSLLNLLLLIPCEDRTSEASQRMEINGKRCSCLKCVRNI